MTKYTQKMLNDFLAMIKDFQEEQAARVKAKADVLSAGLEIDIGTCSVCMRITVPRRLWKKIPNDEKPIGFAVKSAMGMCATHFNAYLRNNEYVPSPLSPDQLEALRRTVGL